MIPVAFQYLANSENPKIIQEWMKVYGIKEVPGTANNPVILSWARDLKVDYRYDSIPWCGLGMGIVAFRAGKKVPNGLLRARNWLNFGVAVGDDEAVLGDTLVFKRGAINGHVGTYVAETPTTFWVLGANQGDTIKIVEIEKSRLLGVRRPEYKVMPATAIKYYVHSDGSISTNEA